MNIKIFLLIFFLSFLIFNLNFTNIGQTDTLPASILPFNILSGHGIYFDEYYDIFKNYYPDRNFTQFEKFNGHIISSYPLISGLMSIPVYAPFYYLMKANSLDLVTNFINFAFILEKLSASIIAALSVALFYYLMLLISRNSKGSIIFALIFGFATQTFSISSQALWQHGTANLFLILSQIYLIKGVKAEGSQRINLIFSILFGAITFAARSTFFLYYCLTLLLLIFSQDLRT